MCVHVADVLVCILIVCSFDCVFGFKWFAWRFLFFVHLLFAMPNDAQYESFPPKKNPPGITLSLSSSSTLVRHDVASLWSHCCDVEHAQDADDLAAALFGALWLCFWWVLHRCIGRTGSFELCAPKKQRSIRSAATDRVPTLYMISIMGLVTLVSRSRSGVPLSLPEFQAPGWE